MQQQQRVGLFASCPVDLFRPSVGFATANLLERAGFSVEVPAQSCCGQVNYNNGNSTQAKKIAWELISGFDAFDYIVTPSGSCGGMIKHHYPELFKGDPRLPQVITFCEKVYELTTFLIEVAGESFAIELAATKPFGDSQQPVIAYHDSCAGLREMNIKQQPRQLLNEQNIAVTEMPETDVCCGFGGTFCVKYSEVSTRMADDKLRNASSVNADLVLGGDVSCLLNLAGRAKRQNLPVSFRHVAEVLAGDLTLPPIGEAND